MPLTGELANLVAFLEDPTNAIVAHLAQNTIVDDPDFIGLGSFVECNYPGYAPIRITEVVPRDMEDAHYAEAESLPLEFASVGIQTPQQVTAIYLTLQKGDGPVNLYWPIVFSTPFQMADDAKPFLYELIFSSSDLVGV